MGLQLSSTRNPSPAPRMAWNSKSCEWDCRRDGGRWPGISVAVEEGEKVEMTVGEVMEVCILGVDQ